MRIVLDTSVLTAASRSRNGASFQLLSLLPVLSNAHIKWALSVSLHAEWLAVMTRPGHLPPGVSPALAEGLLGYLTERAHQQKIHFLWRPLLSDPDDDMVLECALAFGCRLIVTHNLKDFRRARALGVRAVKPSAFLAMLPTPLVDGANTRAHGSAQLRADFEQYLSLVPDNPAHAGDQQHRF